MLIMMALPLVDDYGVDDRRYFMSEKILLEHNATRPHKRKVKLAMEKPYSQREADAAAGMAPPVKSA
jgi:bud site selection protein 20